MLFSYQDRYTQEFFIDKIGEESEHGDPELIERQKAHARRKLDFMMRYAQTHRCRRQMILDYFGDATQVESCLCDVCRQGRELETEAADAAAAPALPEETVTLVRQLLSAIARMRGKFGVGAVAEVLTGAENERVRKWGLDTLSVYGLLRAHTTKRVVAMLHRLLEAGLARQRDPEGTKFMPVIELTAAGVSVMKGEQQPPSRLIDILPRRESSSRANGTNPRALGTNPRAMGTNLKAVADEEFDASQDPDAATRFERLRAVRLQLARDKQLPPYCICHDSTLKLIAVRAPRDVDALSTIKGMGPYKVSQYGEAFLAAVTGNGAAAATTITRDPVSDDAPPPEEEIPMPF
jgi:ATP-dependent DNA helicase RecQ